MEVQPRAVDARPILLFVRAPGDERYLFVGELGQTHSYGTPSGRGYAAANFDLRPTLPADIWSRLGGLAADMSALDAPDADLERLSQLRIVEERLAIVERVVAYWHGLRRPEDGIRVEDLGNRMLPYPLRWWYERYGRRGDILKCPNHLLAPAELQTNERGRMRFYVEEQWVYLWETLASGDDPPVWIQENQEGNPWDLEEESLARFLAQACLLSGISHAPYGASAAWVDQGTLDRLAAAMPPLPLPAWRWPAYPSRLYGRDGAFMFAGPNGEYDGKPGYSVWIGARSERPLQFLKGVVDDSWEYTAF